MAKYAKLSEAMTWHNGQGLFHPNCRHSVSIYIEGVTIPPPPRTPEEIAREREAYKMSQQINYDNRMIQAWKNRVATSITPAEAQKSKATLKAWYAKRKADASGVKTPFKDIKVKPKEKPKAKAKTETTTSIYKTNLTNFENNIRSNKKETAGVLDYEGNILLDKRGNKNSVAFNQAEVDLMKGNMLTHNHPGGSSFSGADIHMLTSNKVNEIRAVATDREYNLKIMPGKETDNNYLSSKGIENKYQDQKKILQSKYIKKVREGMDPTEAWKEHSHELMENLSKELNLIYTRTINK
jgi:hypothetical protein